MKFGGGYAGVLQDKDGKNNRQTANDKVVNEDATSENQGTYTVQIFLLRFTILMYMLLTATVLLLLYLFSMVLVLMAFALFLSFNRKTEHMTKDKAYNNARMMNIIAMFPYSSFLLCRLRDCPMCFETFLPNERVMQLRCDKRHMFHFDCMKEYVASMGQ